MPFRNPMGLALQNSIVATPEQEAESARLEAMFPRRAAAPMSTEGSFGIGGIINPTSAKKPGFLAPGSKGAMIAGIVGDMLAQASGGQAQFLPMEMQRRQREQEASAAEAKWHRERMANREDKQWEWANKPQDPPAMIRNAQAWQQMSPEQRKAYQEMETAQRGDPFVTTTLPNGQFYAGPQSGLIGALTGATAAPVAPKGKLGPVVNSLPGGPQARPAGPFRP